MTPDSHVYNFAIDDDSFVVDTDSDESEEEVREAWKQAREDAKKLPPRKYKKVRIGEFKRLWKQARNGELGGYMLYVIGPLPSDPSLLCVERMVHLDDRVTVTSGFVNIWPKKVLELFDDTRPRSTPSC